MKSRHSLTALTFLAASLACFAVQAEPRYRITPITAAPDDVNIQVFDLNNRGDVVGLRVAGTGQQRAFRWRNGAFTDLHDVIAPSAFATNASDINDLGTISGTINGGQEAFTLRGTTVTPLQVGTGGFTFPLDINNRGQLIVEGTGGGPTGVSDFFVDGDRIETLPGLPDGNGGMLAREINDRGTVVGIAFTSDFSRRGVLWQNGVLTELGLPAGFSQASGTDINIFNRVAGSLVADFQTKAATWKDGTWTLLPDLAPGATQVSDTSSINDLGAIVGATSTDSGRFATLWFLGRAFAIDDLVSADDPLKAFVHLDSALFINNRGDIVSLGEDSRVPGSFQRYFLRLVNE